MKKLTAIFAVLIMAAAIKVNAQGAGKVSVHDISVTKVTRTHDVNGDGRGDLILITPSLKEGTNRMTTKELSGTLVFVKRGETFSDVVFTDQSGKSTRLTPTRGGTNGAPNPECKTKLPDVCFGTADKSIGLCICKPANLSNGDGYIFSYYRTFLLRDASN
jgi:hypothetical protein